MIRKLIKTIPIIAFIVAVLGIFSWLVLKQIVTNKAEKKANNIISLAYAENIPQTPDDKVKAIAAQIFENFEQIDPAFVFLYKFRPYVTNRRLPDFLRLEEGVLETMLEKGLCDNAARFLSFTLKQEGFESIQWDIVAPGGGHAASLVTLPDGRKVYVDPLFGVAAADKSGKLIHPDEAYKLIKAGRRLETVFSPLGEESEYKFYQDFRKVSMGGEDEPLVIESSIPKFQDNLILGEIDKNSQDVQAASAKHGIGTVWNYAGHKYNRNWVRVLKASQPTRVIIALVSDVEKGVVTSESKPEIDGNKMIWNLEKGDKIKFYDGHAKISLKRLNSYIDVDQIAFYKP